MQRVSREKGRTVAIRKEQVVRLDEPPIIRLVGLVDARHRKGPVLRERLREHIRALSLVVGGLNEARYESRVALRSALLEEAHLVATG